MPAVADGSVEEVTVRAPGADVIDIADDVVCDGLPLSLTVTVNLEIPLAVAVPEIAPLPARLRPAGRLPEVIDQV